MVQLISWKKRFLARFQDGCDKSISSNQLTIVIVHKIPEEKEPEVFNNSEIPEEQVTLEKRYYRCIYNMLRFKKEVGVDVN